MFRAFITARLTIEADSFYAKPDLLSYRTISDKYLLLEYVGQVIECVLNIHRDGLI